MPEPVFYIRGVFPPLFERIGASADARDDLKRVANLSDEQVRAIRDRCFSVEGFLDPPTLAATLQEVLEDKEAAASVQRVLRRIAPHEVSPTLQALAQRGGSDGEGVFDEQLLARLSQVLPELIQPYPGLTLFEKAERLATITGQELDSVELVCDLRPIFDDSRTKIEGMMPYTRLRIVATGADGLPNAFEVELTQQQVIDLAKKASKATAKLDVLRKDVTRWLPSGLPDLPLTRVKREEPKDA